MLTTALRVTGNQALRELTQQITSLWKLNELYSQGMQQHCKFICCATADRYKVVLEPAG